MRTVTIFATCTSAALLAMCTATARAQDAEPQSRQALIEQAEAQKDKSLQPYVPTGGERFVTRVQDTFVSPSQTWHPFFENAYHGGGFAAGLGQIHSIDYPDYARFIRVTGTNLDKINRIRIDLKTGEVEQMTAQQAT